MFTLRQQIYNIIIVKSKLNEKYTTVSRSLTKWELVLLICWLFSFQHEWIIHILSHMSFFNWVQQCDAIVWTKTILSFCACLACVQREHYGRRQYCVINCVPVKSFIVGNERCWHKVSWWFSRVVDYAQVCLFRSDISFMLRTLFLTIIQTVRI